MRGIPGSGKSTRARQYTTPELICSADDYFIQPDGKYLFQPHKLADAHSTCLRKFISIVHKDSDIPDDDLVAVVDNTNLRRREYEPYVQVAELAGVPVEFCEFVPPRELVELSEYLKLCAARNSHGVSLAKCTAMASIFEVRR